MRHKILRIATVPIYMNIVLKGQLRFLNRFYNVIAVTGYDEKHFNEIRVREGVEIREIGFYRTIAPLHDLKTLFQLVRLIMKERPAIVHTHTPKAGLLGMIASFICRVPIRIHTVTGMPLMEAEGYRQKVLLLAEKLTYSLASLVYPNSEGLKSYIIDKNLVWEGKLKVLLNGSTNGVDLENFTPSLLPTKIKLRKEYNLKKEDFVFLFVGRIARDKGIEELVNAFVKIEGDFPEGSIKLMLVGKFELQNGPISEETLNLIEGYTNILTPGRFDDVRPFYKISNIFVLPSYREGFPNAVLEAGSMGLPSIVTNINGCNEIISDGINGRVIPVKNEEVLRKVMKEMILNKKNHQLSVNARKIVEERYSRLKLIEELKFEYDCLLKKQND